MYNYQSTFIKNPIKINIIGIEGKRHFIRNSVIFVGDVPDDVKKELLNFKASPDKKYPKLEKFYGKNYANIFSPIKKGGDEFNLDEFIISDDDLKEIQEPQKKYSPPPKLDEINYIFDDICLYRFDKISDFKKKIHAAIGIPIYKQHLYTYNSGKYQALSYDITSSNIPEHYSIIQFLNSFDTSERTIENIPVDMKWYNNKNSYKIVANDDFTIIDKYYKQGITEFNLLNFDEIATHNKLIKLAALFKNDTYQKELFYYSVIFPYWPMITLLVLDTILYDSQQINLYYPELDHNRELLKKQFLEEKKITNTSIDKTNLEKLEEKTKMFITSATMNVLEMGRSQVPVINLRNLFDYFQLDKYIDYCESVIIKDGRKITLKKIYNDNFDQKKMPKLSISTDVNSILYRIRLEPDDTKQSIYLILYKNGNYKIITNWREDMQIQFENMCHTVDSIINPIIKKINDMSAIVLYGNILIHELRKNEVIFTEINAGISYDCAMNSEKFNEISSIMNNFADANIVKTISNNDELQYYFLKGMYEHDPLRIEKNFTLTNYYDYLSDQIIRQKWINIFYNTRTTTITRRLDKLVITITGIKKSEYDIFEHYMVILFYLMENSQITVKKTKLVDTRKKRKTLSDNKERDPELYNSKKKYSSDGNEFIYSRICQKPFQPIMLSVDEYNNLSEEEKNRAIKYWNFTTKKPVYYLSLNPTYKYIKFITNKHPKGYCIPCSKKTPISENKNDPKRIIHDICLNDHVWKKEKKVITENSRYIMSYGKEIEPGRLSRLPSKTLEPILYDSWSSRGVIDKECLKNITTGYYLYGVPQNFGGLSKVGYLYCLSNALGMTVMSLIEKSANYINNQPEKFKILLNGNIIEYFPTNKSFTTAICSLMDSSMNSLELESMGDVINKIFESIAFIFFNINTITFLDRNTNDVDDNLELMLPPKLRSYENFIHDGYDNLIIIKREESCIYNPVYRINTEIFHRTKIINTKLFSCSSEAVLAIIDIVRDSLKIDTMSQNLSLESLNMFIKSSRWKISKIFINKNNLCYYVLITNANKEVYIPVKLSQYSYTKDIKTVYGVIKKFRNPIQSLNTFIVQYNKWIAIESEKKGFINPDIPKKYPLEKRVQPIYPFIILNNWIVCSNVIGFTAQGLNFYIDPISILAAKKLCNKDFLYRRNNPHTVNNIIYNDCEPESDTRSKKIGAAMYNQYLYQLILLEFNNIFANTINKNIRNELYSLLIKFDPEKGASQFSSRLRALIDSNDDYKKISKIVFELLPTSTKQQIIEHLKITRFNFDETMLNKLREKSENDIKKELESIANKIFVKREPKISNFNNIISSCQSSSEEYCDGKKLIVPKDKLDIYLDVLAADIKNPLKEGWLFNMPLTKKVIEFYKFINRQNEYITVDIS